MRLTRSNIRSWPISSPSLSPVHIGARSCHAHTSGSARNSPYPYPSPPGNAAMLMPRKRIPDDMQFTNWKDLHSKGKIADAILVCVLVSR